MPCNCGLGHCPECMGGWTPEPEPEIGTTRWKDKMAISYCIEKGKIGKENMIVKLPKVEGHELGYMAIMYHSGSGTDYFRVNFIVT